VPIGSADGSLSAPESSAVHTTIPSKPWYETSIPITVTQASGMTAAWV
jgi:hypothetical protein